MPMVNVTLRDGTARAVEGRDGLSLMETIREAGIDDLLALCGGSCSCATCHVIVEQSWMPLVGDPGESESDLLDSSSHRGAHSRLSCQIHMSPVLDGIDQQPDVNVVDP